MKTVNHKGASNKCASTANLCTSQVNCSPTDLPYELWQISMEAVLWPHFQVSYETGKKDVFFSPQHCRAALTVNPITKLLSDLACSLRPYRVIDRQCLQNCVTFIEQ